MQRSQGMTVQKMVEKIDYEIILGAKKDWILARSSFSAWEGSGSRSSGTLPSASRP